MPKLPLLLLLVAHSVQAAPALVFRPVETRRETQNLDGDLGGLREAVARDPKNRTARLRLVTALRRAGRFEDALREAQKWRAVDAYNLVVVRLIGDLNVELSRKDEARRAYSAVVELLPNDAQAQRALATVLKQSGDLENAYARLQTAAKLRPDDRRIAFELADTAHRLGKTAEAQAGFEVIAGTNEQLAYPARQRLQQIFGAQLRRADGVQAQELRTRIDALHVAGGLENDIKIYLTWDTDRSDVDLWVTTPAGEKIFYNHKIGAGGESLHDDVTTGYGPESFTARRAQSGTYTVEVNYFSGGRSELDEARGEVVVVLHEGQPDEERHVLPYRLFEPKQTVTVGQIDARGAK
jgi:tetratricopeptide (TPR) repeat protein